MADQNELLWVALSLPRCGSVKENDLGLNSPIPDL